jgi:hypothetical protein
MADQFKSTVAGIPCIVYIDEYIVGSGSYHAASDIDYHGSVSFVILDRKGYEAPWLERKMTPKDESRIYAEIDEYYRDLKGAWECDGAYSDY